MTTNRNLPLLGLCTLGLLALGACSKDNPTTPVTDDIIGTSYPVVGTGQTLCYNNIGPTSAPSAGQPFYGQDAHYPGNAPHYRDNGNGTVSDLVTGLMWQKSPDSDDNGTINYGDKMYFDEARDAAASFALAGHTDWRLPTIKELYSLIMFSGADPRPDAQSPDGAIPYINTDYFSFAYGDLSAGDRIIDAQYPVKNYFPFCLGCRV